MPSYRIRGARAETGEDVVIDVSAEDQAEAEAIASYRKIAVSRVTELEAADPATPAGSPPEQPRPVDSTMIAKGVTRAVFWCVAGVLLLILLMVYAGL